MSEHLENLKESLSALMDDEADELEFRRLLKEVGDNPDPANCDLRHTWHRYHQVRSVMASETAPVCSPDFLSRVREGIEAEELPHRQAEPAEGKGISRVMLAFGQGAIAASVAALVLVASFKGVLSEPDEASADKASQLADNQTPVDMRDLNQVRITGPIDGEALDRLRQAVYREFDGSQESQEIPVSYDFQTESAELDE